MSRGAALSLAARFVFAAFAAAAGDRADDPRPNVVLILTDDQGHGDLSRHGNPILSTPNLDRLAGGGVRLEHFYVSPVCSPTRASLLTGRYHLRTGILDTYLGRSMMRAQERTLAEVLSEAGYRTGLFGKWHLGDNFPLRPMDQGFGDVLSLRGGGLGQPSDPPGGSSYLDPLLFRNGEAKRCQGYVSDVLTDGAIAFVEKHAREPFFLYLAYNCPHSPLEAPAKELAEYHERDYSPGRFPKGPHPLPPANAARVDQLARIYAMVANIDANVGRLIGRIDQLGLRERTLVIFLTDNGPQGPRYNSKMRGTKGTVYEGGIRVPSFWSWPGRFPAGRAVDRIAAHIDVFPTILEACGARIPEDRVLDGESLLADLEGEGGGDKERTLFFQWHRGDEPVRYRNCAVRTNRYKLVQPAGAGERELPSDFSFELYDIRSDPYETEDLAKAHPDAVADLKARYDRWFDDVTSEQARGPVRMILGDERENPATLTRQDWRGPSAGWRDDSLGHWEAVIARSGLYRFRLRFTGQAPDFVQIDVGGKRERRAVAAAALEHEWEFRLSAGPARIQASGRVGGKSIGVHQLDVERVSD